MQDDTKLPAWLARRGYPARLKRHMARRAGARPDRERPGEAVPEPKPPETGPPAGSGPAAPGAVILPFPARDLPAA